MNGHVNILLVAAIAGGLGLMVHPGTAADTDCTWASVVQSDDPAIARAAARTLAVRRVMAALLADLRGLRPGLSVDDEIALRRGVLATVAYSDERVDEQGLARVTAVVEVYGLELAGGVDVSALRGRTYAAVGAVAVLAMVGERTEPRPTGWEGTRPEGMGSAALAATTAAQNAVVERVQTLLSGAGGESAVGRTEQGPVDYASAMPAWFPAVWACFKVEPAVYGPEQVCVVRAQAPVMHIRQVLRDQGIWSNLAASDVDADTLWTVSGLGTAPWTATYARDTQPVPIEAPTWASGVAEAVGRGTLTLGDEDRDAALRAARIDGLLRLSRLVDELPIPYPPGGTVRDVLVSHPADDDVWTAYLRTAWVIETSWEGDVCSVTVGLDLGRLWALTAPRLETTVVRRRSAAG